MRSKARTHKIPVPLVDAFEFLRQPGQPFAEYPSDNAATIGLYVYAIMFPRFHDLTIGISKMHQTDQDIIHDFLKHAVVNGIDLRELLPKPATASALLELAKQPRN